MVHFCTVPGCSNRSDRESHLSYHRLPLKNNSVLKIWIHKIGRKNLPLNESTRVCSEHFVNSRGRMLRSDEVPTLKLPTLPTQVTPTSSRRPLIRRPLPERASLKLSEPESGIQYADAAINTDLTCSNIEALEREVREVKDQLKQSEQAYEDMKGKHEMENIDDLL